MPTAPACSRNVNLTVPSVVPLQASTLGFGQSWNPLFHAPPVRRLLLIRSLEVVVVGDRPLKALPPELASLVRICQLTHYPIRLTELPVGCNHD